MPLPNRNKGETKQAFISRCMSALTKKGEGKDRAQRFAICESRANISLSDEEYNVLENLVLGLDHDYLLDEEEDDEDEEDEEDE